MPGALTRASARLDILALLEGQPVERINLKIGIS
jgi:hypothetical protein